MLFYANGEDAIAGFARRGLDVFRPEWKGVKGSGGVGRRSRPGLQKGGGGGVSLMHRTDALEALLVEQLDHAVVNVNEIALIQAG